MKLAAKKEPQTMQTTNFEIDRESVKRYFLVSMVLGSIGILALIFLPFVPIALVKIVNPGPFGPGFPLELAFFVLSVPVFVLATLSAFFFWLCPQQANNLRYRLEGSTLRADGGVFFLFRKSIPLEQITDVALVQGPLLRYFNIWAMRIQTAGSAQCEAVLYGVRNPEEIRELILLRWKQVYGEKTEDA